MTLDCCSQAWFPPLSAWYRSEAQYPSLRDGHDHGHHAVLRYPKPRVWILGPALSCGRSNVRRCRTLARSAKIQQRLSHQELIENLRGIRKVVINRCHGGFGLSHEAILRYHALSKTQIFWRDLKPDSDWCPKLYYLDAECLDHNHWSDTDLDRDDPVLVRVVEEMGGDVAGSDYAVLKVVRIPGDVDWVIHEHDGLEWVAERHRTWE